MGIRRKVFYPVAFSAMLFASSAMAKVNPTAFVGVSEFFLKDKAKNIDMGFYDPTLGEVALESGLIENIRFFGAYEAGAEHKDDTSTDPLWNVTKILFPSINGQLGTTTDAVTNFAKYVKNPKTVALLLNYAKKVEDVKGKGSLPAKVTQQFTVDILKTLEGMGAGKSTIDNFKKKTLNPLLTAIRESIESEKKGTSLYPRHTTEQVLEAFFCYQFNTQEDIWKLLEDLDGSIVDKNKPLPTQAHYLKEEDLKEIAAKPTLNLDDLFDLTQANIFTSPTPYKDGINLLNNGVTNSYDRTQNSYVQGSTFQDCVEMSLRHICNLLLFNPDAQVREFDLKSIENFVAKKETETGIKNPYFDKLQDFYSKQSLILANAGDIGTRSLWNTVMGDLNAVEGGPQIIYRRNGKNEMRSGFVNLLYAAEKIFSLSLKPVPTGSLQEKEDWVKESLNTLFSTLHPAYEYTIDLTEFTEEENDLMGEAGITVTNSGNAEDLFFFNLHTELSSDGGHTEVNKFKVLQQTNASEYVPVLKTHAASIQEGTSEESLWLLEPAVAENQVHHPLYKLYSQSLSDDSTKVNFLKNLHENYDDWKTNYPNFKNNLPFLQSMVKNVLNKVSWEDGEILQKASPWVLGLAQNDDLKKTILTMDGIKTIDLRGLNIATLRGLEILPNLEELKLIGTTAPHNEISFIEPLALKKLNLWQSKISTLSGLENLPELETLDLRLTSNLSQLSLTEQQENLKSLRLLRSGIQVLTGLENVPNLEELNLSNTTRLTKIAFTAPLKNLDLITLQYSGIQELTGLDNLEQLTGLDLRGATNIRSLKFEKDNKELHLSLRGSGIRSRDDIEGFEHLDPSKVRF